MQLPLVTTAPAVDTAAVQRFVAGFANPAMASAVTLRLGQDSVRLQPSSYGRLLGAEKAGHRLRPTVQADGLAALVADKLGGKPADAPRDATIALVDGRPQVVSARAGKVFGPDSLAAALLHAIRTTDRTARGHADRQPASFTDADARALGITDQISSETLHLPSGSHVGGLVASAERLDGTVLKPGDSLSLRDRLGAAVPGDQSATQLATATFGAAWLGGLEIGSHANLPAYTRTYPMGRDATLRDGQDLTFVDSTRDGVLVSVTTTRPSATHAGSLVVSLWSTPRWSVSSDHDTPAQVVPAGRVVHPARAAERGPATPDSTSPSPAPSPGSGPPRSTTARRTPCTTCRCRPSYAGR